jgi:hypothetical protein
MWDGRAKINTTFGTEKIKNERIAVNQNYTEANIRKTRRYYQDIS